MRALITGAAGLIGGHLVRALNSRGHNVRAAGLGAIGFAGGYSDRAAQIDEGAVPMDADNEAPYVAAKIAQHRRALELGDRLRLDVRLACPTLTLGPTGSRLGPSNALIVAHLADPFACTFPRATCK